MSCEYGQRTFKVRAVISISLVDMTDGSTTSSTMTVAIFEVGVTAAVGELKGDNAQGKPLGIGNLSENDKVFANSANLV